jgi:hypothetical protein
MRFKPVSARQGLPENLNCWRSFQMAQPKTAGIIEELMGIKQRGFGSILGVKKRGMGDE